MSEMMKPLPPLPDIRPEARGALCRVSLEGPFEALVASAKAVGWEPSEVAVAMCDLAFAHARNAARQPEPKQATNIVKLADYRR